MPKKLIFTCFIFCFALSALGQNTYSVKILDQESKSPIIGASLMLSPLKINAVANSEGVIFIKQIPNGKQFLTFSALGFLSKTDSIIFPNDLKDTIIVYLVPVEEELDEIIVTSTRSSRTIEDEPKHLIRGCTLILICV